MSLADFTACRTYEDIQAEFFRTARVLMLEHDLQYEKRAMEITAIELYLYYPEVWQDCATDKAPEQLKHGIWYIRRRGWVSQWRIDLAVGNGEHGIYAGLLIAGIDGLNGSGYALNSIVYGAVSKRRWKYDAEILDRIHTQPVDSSDSALRLAKREVLRTKPIWMGPRRLGAKLSARIPERFKSSCLRVSTVPEAGESLCYPAEG